jgi:hypothetical protein
MLPGRIREPTRASRLALEGRKDEGMKVVEGFWEKHFDPCFVQSRRQKAVADALAIQRFSGSGSGLVLVGDVRMPV